MSETMRIAMWSGPRNLSTAMMRSFGARSDTRCVDEPFYAAFLTLTGLDHPMREDILRAHETDPDRVAEEMRTGGGSALIFYQKHMTHHMVDGIPRDWMADVENVFLVRHPARVLASYAKKMETVSLAAIGFPQQAELFQRAWSISGKRPVVIDADTVLRRPADALDRLCQRIGIPFDPAMLTWASGPKPEDGAWAPHWYDAVNASTGFADPIELPDVSIAFQSAHSDALAIYNGLLEQGDTV